MKLPISWERRSHFGRPPIGSWRRFSCRAPLHMGGPWSRRTRPQSDPRVIEETEAILQTQREQVMAGLYIACICILSK